MDMANQFLALSMFIMLLSFFIILNTVSYFEVSKSETVLNSIALTFSAREAAEPMEPNVTPSPQQSTKEGDALDQLDALFNTQITGVETKTNRLRTVMHTRMELAEFEQAILMPAGGAGGLRSAFLPTLVSLINAQQSKIPYRMDMVLNMPESPAKAATDAPEGLNNVMRKAAVLAERLEKGGLPKKLLSTGVARGDVGMIDIYIRRYEPFNPAPLLEPEEAAQ